MLVAEVVIRKSYIEDKIKDIKNYLAIVKDCNIPDEKRINIYSEGMNFLFLLYDDLQSYKLSLRRSNDSNTIQIGKTVLKVSEALAIFNTFENKIKVLDSAIDNCDPGINLFELIKQRDKTLEEQLMMLSSIKKSDWSTNVE
jgi:hypothetical protein